MKILLEKQHILNIFQVWVGVFLYKHVKSILIKTNHNKKPLPIERQFSLKKYITLHNLDYHRTFLAMEEGE